MRAGASAAGALQLVVGGEGVEGDEALTFVWNHNSACVRLGTRGPLVDGERGESDFRKRE